MNSVLVLCRSLEDIKNNVPHHFFTGVDITVEGSTETFTYCTFDALKRTVVEMGQIRNKLKGGRPPSDRLLTTLAEHYGSEYILIERSR